MDVETVELGDVAVVEHVLEQEIEPDAPMPAAFQRPFDARSTWLTTDVWARESGSGGSFIGIPSASSHNAPGVHGSYRNLPLLPEPSERGAIPATRPCFALVTRSGSRLRDRLPAVRQLRGRLCRGFPRGHVRDLPNWGIDALIATRYHLSRLRMGGTRQGGSGMRRIIVVVFVVAIFALGVMVTPGHAWLSQDGCITYRCWLENTVPDPDTDPSQLNGLIRVDIFAPLNAWLTSSPCPITKLGRDSCSGENLIPKQPTLTIGAWSTNAEYVACRDVYSDSTSIDGTCRIAYAPNEDGTTAHPFHNGQAPGTVHDSLGCGGWDFQPSSTEIGSVDFKDAAGIHWKINSLTIETSGYASYRGSRWANSTMTMLGHAGTKTITMSLSGSIDSTQDCQLGDQVTEFTLPMTGSGNVS